MLKAESMAWAQQRRRAWPGHSRGCERRSSASIRTPMEPKMSAPSHLSAALLRELGYDTDIGTEEQA